MSALYTKQQNAQNSLDHSQHGKENVEEQKERNYTAIFSLTIALEHEQSKEYELKVSDHFPIIIEEEREVSIKQQQRWSIERANWTQFQKESAITTKRQNQNTIEEAPSLESYLHKLQKLQLNYHTFVLVTNLPLYILYLFPCVSMLLSDLLVFHWYIGLNNVTFRP